jgi:hypothetical protein
LNLLTFLRESTWGYPIISAIHVLGIAWFGGTVLIARFAEDLRRLRQSGFGVLVVSGALLFLLHPFQYSSSTSFRVKMALLLLLIQAKVGSRLSFALWIAIIFASRGIAFF